MFTESNNVCLLINAGIFSAFDSMISPSRVYGFLLSSSRMLINV